MAEEFRLYFAKSDAKFMFTCMHMCTHCHSQTIIMTLRERKFNRKYGK